ncbi:threonine dehydratase [Massilia sp. TS11]|uniref:threonine dehydratase n=1 Tax=Massilia sp. TS11 TaxID=2908003 RepID=UPI001EDA4D88|nr:threonine dehydratase [Massilia sp. TS11]MCG2583310.1 threonine dehydratase [Massilia sp. TS11]
MTLPTLTEIETAARLVYAAMPPTPQYSWPLLNAALGTETWLKHENHTPLGAFKARGGVVYTARLQAREPHCSGIISATRGNHGQAVTNGARRVGLAATIVVPRGNNLEKNAAMRALGATLIEHGADFQEAREHARALAAAHGLHIVPSYHPDLVAGVASYWLELFRAQPGLDLVFVPIGQGSGICAAIAARQALGLRTRIVGVVSAHAPAYALSLAEGRLCEAPVSTVLADGMACRVPDPDSWVHIQAHVDEIVQVSDDEVARAMRLLYRSTHNLAEGAGAAATAAALQWQAAGRLQGLRVGLPLTGANVDASLMRDVLLGD